MRLALALVVVVSASCFVDRASDRFECTDPSQCEAGRTCSEGFCIVDEGTKCPASCNAGCIPGQRECSVVCNAVTECGQIECPDGWECDIVCDGPGACGDIRCEGDANCYLTCITSSSCGAITCGNGVCDVGCNEANACGPIDCTDACACDVDCSLGDCGAQSCPSSEGIECISGDACDSTGCDRC